MNLSAQRAYVKERFGDAGWSRVLARLSAQDVAEVWGTLILPEPLKLESQEEPMAFVDPPIQRGGPADLKFLPGC